MERVNAFSTDEFSNDEKKRVRELVVQAIIKPETFVHILNDPELIETLRGILKKHNVNSGSHNQALGKRNRGWVNWIWWPWSISYEETPTLNKYFVISATIKDSKPHSGYRKRIYEDASLYGAMYDIRGPHPSIWYPDDSSDLHISLMFMTEEKAYIFINCLIEYNIGSLSLMKGKLDVCTKAMEVDTEYKGVFVLRNDYKFEDSDSPSNTYDDVRSPTEVLVDDDPLKQMRSLINISQLPPGDTLYKCHIAPQGANFYPQYAKDKDNILLGSHLFHLYFDGDGKR
eukprot:gene17058-23466_t